MKYENLKFTRDGGVGIISLNRPDKLNALTESIWDEITNLLDEIFKDDSIVAVLLRGEGKSFCAGFDIKKSTDSGHSNVWDQWSNFQVSHDQQMKMWDYPKPIVCAVQGYCLGGGFELAGLCDFVIAADDAVFGETELRFCLMPGPLNVYTLGLRNSKEIMLLAEKFGAEKAKELGVCNRVVPRDKLEEESMRVAQRLASMPGETMRIAKRMINKAADLQGFKVLSDWAWDSFLISKMVVPKLREEFNEIGKTQGMAAAFKWLNDRYEPK